MFVNNCVFTASTSSQCSVISFTMFQSVCLSACLVSVIV